MTTPDAQPRRHRFAWRPSRITLVALLLIATQLIVRGALVSQSWFLLDDHFFLSDIARNLDDPEWYLRLHQSHFMPLSFLLVKLVATLGGPFNWTAVVVEIMVLQLLASLACWWMLRTLFGPGRAALAGLAVYLTSALTMPALLWWAVAINQYPHQIAFFGALTAHVLYARSHRVRWVLVATLFLVVGYMSYAKTGLIVVTLVLLTLIWLQSGPPWERLWGAVRRYWIAWFAYGSVSLAWLAVYLTRPQDRIPGTPSQYLAIAEAELFRAGLPTFVGGPLRWSLFGTGPVQFADPPVTFVVVSTLLIALLLLLAWGRNERSLLILWPVGLYLFASSVLVYTGRAFSTSILGGQEVGKHVQYLSDAAPLLVLAGVALFRPVLGVADPIRTRRKPLVRLTVPHGVGAGALGVVVAAGLYSSVVYTQPFSDFEARQVNKLAIEQIRTTPDLVLADSLVPDTMMSAIVGDNAFVRNHFAPLADSFSVASIGVDLRTFDDSGTLVRADAVPVPDARPSRELDGCVPVSNDGTEFVVPPPPAFGQWLAVDYSANRAGWILVTGVGVRHGSVDAPPGIHRLLAAAPQPTETVTVFASPNSDVCVTALRYGLVGPS